MRIMEDEFEDIRSARRKKQKNITCRFESNPTKFSVYELSSHGFSFLCPRDLCFFKRGAIFDKISIFNEEGLEIIAASGTIVHTVEFGFDEVRIGVSFNKKRMDRTIPGKIRIKRHSPKIQINAMITVNHKREALKLSGSIIDYTASTARVGFSGVDSYKFQIGEEVNILMEVEDTVLFNGPAYVLRIKDDGTEIIVHFFNQLLDISHIEATSLSVQNRNRILSMFVSLNDYRNISDEFKALICDWRLYLNLLKKILDQEERSHHFRLESEKELFLQSIEDNILTDLRNFITRLNSIAERIPETESLPYKKYFRENLLPFIRSSPLAASIIDKDNGYPGDFETIKQFFLNPYSGDKLFAKMMNKFICSTDAVLAHQERIQFLYEQLCKSYKNSDGKFSFLVFGSGPAEEVLRFVENSTFKKPVHATLLDMDAFALADFSERLQFLPRENFEVELININILNLLRNEESNPIKSQYSLIYCAGLFDYFKKHVCKRMVRLFLKHTKPGGSVVVTNVHKSNTTRYFMDYGGGWEIIHRDNREMSELVPAGFPFESYSDKNHTNIFMKINVARENK